jgi:hypothetical protein
VGTCKVPSSLACVRTCTHNLPENHKNARSLASPRRYKTFKNIYLEDRADSGIDYAVQFISLITTYCSTYTYISPTKSESSEREGK